MVFDEKMGHQTPQDLSHITIDEVFTRKKQSDVHGSQDTSAMHHMANFDLIGQHSQFKPMGVTKPIYGAQEDRRDLRKERILGRGNHKRLIDTKKN